VFRGDQLEARITHRMHLWYRTGVTPKMQVSYGSRTFQIISVKNVEERNRVLELMLEERA
jgi:head-tail adaptor